MINSENTWNLDNMAKTLNFITVSLFLPFVSAPPPYSPALSPPAKGYTKLAPGLLWEEQGSKAPPSPTGADMITAGSHLVLSFQAYRRIILLAPWQSCDQF